MSASTFKLRLPLDGFVLTESGPKLLADIAADERVHVVRRGELGLVRVGMPDRHAVILEVEGEGGEPPYRVRWEDNSHEGIFFPGPDAAVLPVA